jgi:redox-sensitive bicupin YhaK (pirin superfamily)
MSEASIDLVVEGRPRDLGGFTVTRVLPIAARRAIGPFVFLDHMGPLELAAGVGFDVRPHPHIGLSTVTYLFDGAVMHRDSIGSVQVIVPGDVNWMTAGRGIVHSERSPDDARARGGRMHGLQIWVALPLDAEESAPSFHHHPASTLPEIVRGAARVRVIAGTAYGATSPAKTHSPLSFVDATLPAGAALDVEDVHAERAVYVIEGAVAIGERTCEPHRLIVLSRGTAVVRAARDSRIALIGGAPLEGPRHIDWNFVSSSRERIARAKDDWRARRFPAIPSDDQEFIPLP